MIPATDLALTLGAYGAGRAFNSRYPSPWTTPVCAATALVLLGLVATGHDYADYLRDSRGLLALLGPATAALAVPVYRHRRLIVAYSLPAIVGIVCGALATFVAAVMIATGAGLAPLLVRSIALKSVTIPIAVELVPLMGGDASLCVGLVVASGMIGAILGPWILNSLGIRDQVLRGLTYGTIAMGLGTVQAATEGEIPAAVSALAMGVAGVFMSMCAPAVIRLFT